MARCACRVRPTEDALQPVEAVAIRRVRADTVRIGSRERSDRHLDDQGRLIGTTKGGLNSKLDAVTDAVGRPVPQDSERHGDYPLHPIASSRRVVGDRNPSHTIRISTGSTNVSRTASSALGTGAGSLHATTAAPRSSSPPAPTRGHRHVLARRPDRKLKTSRKSRTDGGYSRVSFRIWDFWAAISSRYFPVGSIGLCLFPSMKTDRKESSLLLYSARLAALGFGAINLRVKNPDRLDQFFYLNGLIRVCSPNSIHGVILARCGHHMQDGPRATGCECDSIDPSLYAHQKN